MNLLNLAARLIGAAIREGVAEYRKLDAPEAEYRPEMSCTSATTERAEPAEAPATAFAFGFRRPS